MLLLQLRYEGRDTCLGTTTAPCLDVPAISMQALHLDFLVYLYCFYIQIFLFIWHCLRPACQNRLNILWKTWSHV